MTNRIRKIHGIYKEKQYILKARRLSKKKSVQVFGDNYPVDIVVTWVDGNDPVWRQEKNKYVKESGIEGNNDARFREWGFFRYWFRMIEQYAPWVNKVFLVTYGHVPDWLEIDCPKLCIVNHSDFIPPIYLPTFSSVTIELNLWRIHNLSEHFIYFNDDMFLTKPVKPSDFFENGLPKYAAIAEPLMNYGDFAFFQHELFSNLGIINKYFNIREVISNNPEKWFSYVYGNDIHYNIQAYNSSSLPGLWFNHLATPYRKSTFEKVWTVIPDRLDWTCNHRFREALDLMHQIVELWDICEGSFIPVSRHYYGTAPVTVNDEAIDAILKGNNICVCLNDSASISDDMYYQLRTKCLEKLDTKFPAKSVFER